MFCFVLKPAKSVIINGIECAVWGHNLQDDIVKHDYYGSDDIVNDLKLFKDWSKGKIVVQNGVKQSLEMML